MTRERDIIDLVCSGHSNKEIAYRTGTSARTVETHLTRILGKAKVNSRAQLIVLELTGGRPWEA